jgi:hypothetical protein
VLSGTWILALLPILGVLDGFGWFSRVPVPTVFHAPGMIETLDHTLLGGRFVYPPLMFCTGAVLLFSAERGRRRHRLDSMRRWGVLCIYGVSVISAASMLFIGALVLAGIAAIFHGMPAKFQPGVTELFVNVSAGYLRYGAHPGLAADVALTAFSSVAGLLACVPLFDAVRACGPRWLAGVVVAPLGLFALMHLARAGQFCLGPPGGNRADLYQYWVYFAPDILASGIKGRLDRVPVSGSAAVAFWVEAVKGGVVLVVALWLSVARVVPWKWSRRP